MNILVINGSPKSERSNTLRLTNAFLDGICSAQKDNPPHIEQLDIAKMDIQSCLGCFSCWKSTPGKCCIQDDMQTVLEKLLWADLTIWSFPLYYFSLPGKLKIAIDRQLPLMLPFMLPDVEGGAHPHRYDITGKKTVLISTCGFYTPKSNYDSIIAQFDKMCGKANYTTLFCGEGELFRVPELASRTNEYLDIVRQAGQEYVSGGITPKTTENLEELLFPRDVFERMANASWGVSETGEMQDPSLTFTKQMATLYQPASYNGSDIILDMDYTDIGKRYRLILGETEARVVENFEKAPTTIIHTPFSVWKSIAAGEIKGAEALMKRLYSVEGDFGLLLKWDTYFGQRSYTKTAKSKQAAGGKTDMRYLLAPWITFWIATSIDPLWGSILSLLVCCLLPILFFKNQKTIYDVISSAAITVLSILLFLNFSEVGIITSSYFMFGLMWSLSATRNIPLSAEYSMNRYGGEEAFSNPIFMKTNRILTAAWGILYLISSIWTYFIMSTPAAGYIGIINSIIPAVMGGFTVWFERWYPNKIAKGK